jgi:SAM-dependent methyltransferase
MTSSYENGANPKNEPARHQQRTKPVSSEAAYERLSAYRFAQRYAKGKTVADLSHEEAGYGSLLLAQSAQSVAALTDLSKLPLLESRFDVVVAFGVIESLEHPEELVEEAKRVLKEDGVLLISVADKRTGATSYRAGVDGQRGMYVPDFRVLLEHHFGHVRLYRQGAVAGGFVFPVSKELTGGGVPVESVRLSLNDPRFGVEPPTTYSVMAVCSDDAEALGREEQPYLLLDRDRRVFAECEERAEDVELMRDEIRQMQETEVQAFVEAIKVRQSLVRELLRSPYSYRNLIFEEIRYRRSIILGNMHAIRQKDARGLARGALRRLSALYRREGQKP